MKHASIVVLAAYGALASFPMTAAAEAASDISALRAEIAQLKAAYEERIQALERRLNQVQSPSAAKATESARPVAAAVNAFNPEISLILSGMATSTKLDPRQDASGAAGRERRIQGLMPSGGEFNPEARSWNLGESELAISANIDPHFRGTLLAALSPANEVGVEEANIQTLGLGAGLNIKAGRFLSGIGYANEQHPHAWDFSNASLPHQAFFGSRLGYDGMQIKWLAPTDLFLEFGLETGRARGFPSSDAARNKNGLMSGSAFARLGDDIGMEHSWRLGASFFAAKPGERAFDDIDSSGTVVTNRFSGTSRTVGLDFVWKWRPHHGAQSFKFQSEWFRRKESGQLTYNGDNAVGAFAAAATGDFGSAQSGWYAQGVWGFAPAWRVGYRYEQLGRSATSIGLIDQGVLATNDLPLLEAFKPQRQTMMLDWAGSEFSRIRLQFAHDRTRPGAADRQFWLHYIMNLGAHGAHKF